MSYLILKSRICYPTINPWHLSLIRVLKHGNSSICISLHMNEDRVHNPASLFLRLKNPQGLQKC